MSNLRQSISCRRTLASHWFVHAILAGALVQAVPTAASAEVHVEGQPDAVQVEARGATVGEVLTALGTLFKLRYMVEEPLNQPISGTYQGPLPQVIRRVLEGYDYVLKSIDDSMDLVIYGAAGATAQPSPYGQIPIKEVAGATRNAVAQVQDTRRALEALSK